MKSPTRSTVFAMPVTVLAAPSAKPCFLEPNSSNFCAFLASCSLISPLSKASLVLPSSFISSALYKSLLCSSSCAAFLCLYSFLAKAFILCGEKPAPSSSLIKLSPKNSLVVGIIALHHIHH